METEETALESRQAQIKKALSDLKEEQSLLTVKILQNSLAVIEIAEWRYCFQKLQQRFRHQQRSLRLDRMRLEKKLEELNEEDGSTN
jgi:hypothetical protein